MSNGLRYSANERKKEKYNNTPVEERQKKLQDLKKKLNLKCSKCKTLISKGNKSGLCKSCFQKDVWAKRKRVLINGVEMQPGMTFGKKLSIEDSEDKKKLKSWLEEDNWEIEDGK